MNDIIIFLQHHLILTGALALVFGAVIVVEIIESSGRAFKLTPQKVVEYINHNNARLIDIREPEAFKKGHIVHTLNMVEHDLKANSARLKPYQNDILILIDTGDDVRTSALARQLIKAGYQKTHILAGGMRSWIAAGFPLEK